MLNWILSVLRIRAYSKGTDKWWEMRLSSDEGVGWPRGDATLVFSPLHPDIAILAPFGRPRVLDQPITGAVAHCQPFARQILFAQDMELTQTD